MGDFPTFYGKQEAFKRYIEERQRAKAYTTYVVYALVFCCILGVLCCALEMFRRQRRVRQEERRREEEHRHARHWRMYQLHQMLREGLHDD